jgi:hypothetical protein
MAGAGIVGVCYAESGNYITKNPIRKVMLGARYLFPAQSGLLE